MSKTVSMWMLSFTCGHYLGSLVVLARNATEARKKLADKWSLQPSSSAKFPNLTTVHDNTMPFVPNIDDLIKEEEECDGEKKEKEYGCVFDQVDEGQRIYKKFHTISEMIQEGYIVRIKEHVMLNLALYG